MAGFAAAQKRPGDVCQADVMAQMTMNLAHSVDNFFPPFGEVGSVEGILCAEYRYLT